MTTATGRDGSADSSGIDEGTMSADERAAMKERAAELRTASRRGSGAAKAAADAQDVADKIAEMTGSDREIAERVHEIVLATAPELAPRTWYGMPAYAKDGKLVCFFKAATKYKSRYATLGFEERAQLDDGAMWPTSYALLAVGEAEERVIADLVRRAVR